MKRTLGLTLLLFATLFSCMRQEKPLPAELSRAESVMWEHPDSALLCLSSLDSSIMNEPENIRMYHALLKIKVKDKLYIPHESDSLIKSIVQYYEDYGTPDQLMEAYYYLGSTYRDMGDAPRAVRAFQDAADIGKDSKRYDILGRVYEQMGYRLAYQGLYDEALEAYRKSYEYKMYDKGKGEVIALRNIARIYNAKQDTDSAIYYYQSAYEKALLLNDQSRIDNVLRELSSIYIDMGKYDLAKDLFSKVSSMKNQANIYFGLGCIYESYKQIDSALYYFEKANELECTEHDQDTFSLPRQYLQKPDGRVYHEGSGEESRSGAEHSDRVSSHQHRGDRQSGVSAGSPQAVRAWHRLFRQTSPAAPEQRLREVRPSDWHGSSQSAEYVPDLRRRFCRQDAPADGLYQPSRRGGRSVVHRRFRHDLAGCGGRLPGIAPKNNQQRGSDERTSWLSRERKLVYNGIPSEMTLSA